MEMTVKITEGGVSEIYTFDMMGFDFMSLIQDVERIVMLRKSGRHHQADVNAKKVTEIIENI